jgi:Xaa-Pro dipeptidase
MDLKIAEKVSRRLAAAEFDAIIAVGADNFQYLTGAPLPFLHSATDRYVAVFWPKRGDPECICPTQWASTMQKLGRIRNVHSYIESGDNITAATEKLKGIVRGIKSGGTLGLDMGRCPTMLFEALQKSLSELKLQNCDDFLNDLRRVKTPEEVRLLSDVAYRTDHGIQGATHHIIVTAPRTEMAFAEEVRVHCIERGLETLGYDQLSLMASGENSKKFWPYAPFFGIGGGEKELKEHETVRVEMRSSIDGYWSDAARMVIMGEPSADQNKTYDGLVALRTVAVEAMRPGAKCSEIAKMISEEGKRKGIELIRELGFGHGVGVTTYEPPYICESDNTPLETGMVLVLDPVVYGPQREIMRSKDTVLITDRGCKILNWYKDWRTPFIPARVL